MLSEQIHLNIFFSAHDKQHSEENSFAQISSFFHFSHLPQNEKIKNTLGNMQYYGFIKSRMLADSFQLSVTKIQLKRVHKQLNYCFTKLTKTQWYIFQTWLNRCSRYVLRNLTHFFLPVMFFLSPTLFLSRLLHMDANVSGISRLA